MPFRILIADDNPAVRTVLRQLLAATDREIIEAEDGAAAVSKSREHRPDIAILDLAMPAMDGLTAARHISMELPQTVLVMCTMHWSPQLEVEAQKSGIRQVVSKSQGPELVAVVRELLGAKDSAGISLPESPLVLPQEPVLPAAILDSVNPQPEAAATEIASPVEKNPEKSS
jgi:CheY-like chemotaxis protein